MSSEKDLERDGSAPAAESDAAEPSEEESAPPVDDSDEKDAPDDSAKETANRKADKAEPSAKCSACQAPLAKDAMFCKRCGAPQKGAPTCPHCGAIADISPHDEVILKCNACGAPRVVLNKPGIELSGGEKEPLEQAKSARLARLAWWIGGTAAALVAVGLLGTTALVSLLLGMSLFAAGMGLAMTVPFALLAMLAFRRAKERTKDVAHAVDTAWMSAAKDITSQSKEPITANELSEILPLSERRTEQLLARLAVDDMLHSDITPDGRLSFAPALRIEEPDDSAASEAQAVAELEQLAAEEAAAAADKRARAARK